MMKRWLKSAAAVGFLILFLPYTVTLLIDGKQGIHREEELPPLEYQVLSCLMNGDYAWMEDGTLHLMAILYRTECVRGETEAEGGILTDLYGPEYDRMYEAVLQTRGQVITVDGEYRELPYHAVSGGQTREGLLLGAEYDYVLAADCPLDKESEEYLRRYRISEKELGRILGLETSENLVEEMVLERDGAGYVSRVSAGGREWQGEAFRSLLHLPSSCFWLEEDPDGTDLYLTVQGSGHGFGLSLYTADRMIREGSELQEVIEKFYRNAACITIP